MTPPASSVILLVEDDEGLRQLVMDSLQGNQYWVFCARNGEEAWDLFSEHWPIMRLLLTEVVLSDMDGLALALVPANSFLISQCCTWPARTNCQRPCVRAWRILAIRTS